MGKENSPVKIDPAVESGLLRELGKWTDEGRIPCSEALRLAEEQGVSPLVVAALINRLRLKITTCQLGCFK